MKSKKALIFIEDGSYTYDNRVKQEASALIENGWSVRVICPRYKGDKIKQKYNDNLIVYHYPKPNMRSTFGHIIEHSISFIMGVIFTCFVFIGFRFKVFHACNPTDILWLVYAPYRLFGVRFIFDQHDLSPEVYLSRPGTSTQDVLYKLSCWLENKSFNSAASVIATNQSYKNIALSRGKKSNHDVYIVRNGPILSKFDLSQIKFKSQKLNEVWVGYVGNMNLQDGVEEIIYAAKRIKKECNRNDVKFILIGGGSNQQYLVKMSKKADLDDIIYFVGRVSDEEMLSTLRSCDFCIQPDPFNPLNDVSTMNKVMEYMALGKSFVAYELKETVFSGADCGLYAKNNDREDFVNKILILANDKQLRLTLGQKGRERIEEHLAWDYSIPHLLKAYEHAFFKRSTKIKY
jgi:glycosyltransferase involved in cell wall biosynthesis